MALFKSPWMKIAQKQSPVCISIGSLILLITLTMHAMAQDVTITFTAKFQGTPVPLDSILLENLNNHSTVVMHDLPAGVTTYEINLSQGKIVYGMAELSRLGRGFFPYSNLPGVMRFIAKVPSPTCVTMIMYDLPGRLISTVKQDCPTGVSVVNFHSGQVSSGILVAEGGGFHAVFKIIGGKDNSGATFCTVENTLPKGFSMSMPVTASPSSASFLFNPGDSVRFTVYGQAIYPAMLTCGPVQGDSLMVKVTRPCPGVLVVTDYDSNTYTTVQIGNQCWLRENMNAMHYSDGTALVDGTGAGQINEYSEVKYWFYYGDSPSNGPVYGRLYTWTAAVNYSWAITLPQKPQGICPVGWHIPGDDEWKTLESFLGMDAASLNDCRYYRGTDEGGKLKETGTSHWLPYNFGATNESGFIALPGGERDLFGHFFGLRTSGWWWTSSHLYTNSLSPMSRNLDHGVATIKRSCSELVPTGISVRCVKDE